MFIRCCLFCNVLRTVNVRLIIQIIPQTYPFIWFIFSQACLPLSSLNCFFSSSSYHIHPSCCALCFPTWHFCLQLSVFFLGIFPFVLYFELSFVSFLHLFLAHVLIISYCYLSVYLPRLWSVNSYWYLSVILSCVIFIAELLKKS